MIDTCTHVYRMNILAERLVMFELYASSVFFVFSDCYRDLAVSLCLSLGHTCTSSSELVVHPCLPLPEFVKTFTSGSRTFANQCHSYNKDVADCFSNAAVQCFQNSIADKTTS